MIIPGGSGRGPRKTIDSRLWSWAVCCRIECLRLDICCLNATVKNNLQLLPSVATLPRSPAPGSSREAAMPNAGLDARPLSDVQDDERESGRGWDAEIMTEESSVYEG